ncbi:MAG: hypothetical protein QOK05_2549 [Chloroflexota bacterium]|jgi:hypothetical protein|nr:hypothetical protein [Chloroflexota bacterium]
MRSVRLALAGLGLAAPLALAGCGGAASSGGGDPVVVAQDYINAVKGSPTGGTQFLESESTEKLTGTTSLSRFLGANKSASAQIVPVQWIPPTASAPISSKKQCLIGQPAPAQICIVTVTVTGGKPSPAYFHINLENRYNGKWQIINVDQVEKSPDNLLPTGNEAHAA